ncbi:MAG: aminotransferase class I/II-fold pyridoxal phosphate-dependent enzyme, partial [Thermoleophilaceae bacterium]
EAGDTGRRLVAVDGLFSMEGDVADLERIVPVCEEEEADVYVDEAHAIGVLGERGAGACEVFAVEDRVQIRTGTLSKALASQGGFVAASADVIDHIRFHARAMLFTASTPPAAVASALASVRFCRTGERAERAAVLLDNARYLRRGLYELGYDVMPALATEERGEVITPIVRIGVGDSATTLRMWRALYEAGVYVHAALYPAVPPAQAMLRATVIHGHTREHLDQALTAFEAARRILAGEDNGRVREPAGSVSAARA